MFLSRRSCFSLLLIVVCLGTICPAFASDGGIDTTFGTSGYGGFTPACFVSPHGQAVQDDGKILVVGRLSYGGNEADDGVAEGCPDGADSNSPLFVARANIDGSPDNSFATNGFFRLPLASASDSSSALAVVVQPDGKIVVGGSDQSEIMLLRLMSDGTQDMGFGVNGEVLINATGSGMVLEQLAMQPDGKIVAIGTGMGLFATTVELIRCNSDGSQDSSFGNNGVVLGPNETSGSAEFNAHQGLGVVVSNDQSIYVLDEYRTFGGTSVTGLLRYLHDGSPDTSFGGGVDPRGFVVFNYSSYLDGIAIAQQADGKLLAYGAYTTQDSMNNITGTGMALARFSAAGLADTTFGTAGIYTTAALQTPQLNYVGQMLAVQPDGKILIEGIVDEYLTSGPVEGENTGFGMQRLTAAGVMDATFGTSGMVSDFHPDSVAIDTSALFLNISGRVGFLGAFADYEHKESLDIGFSRLLNSDFGSNIFHIAPVANVAPGTVVTSAPITVAGISGLGQGTINVSGGSYSIGCTPVYLTTPGVVLNGQTICVRQTTSGNYDAWTNTFLTIGEVTATFTGVTEVKNAPNAFMFQDVDGIATNTVVTSNTVTISGLTGSAPISVANGTYSIGCTGTFTAQTSTISNGNTVCIRQTSAMTPSTSTTTTLTIGSGTGTFTSTTASPLGGVTSGGTTGGSTSGGSSGGSTSGSSSGGGTTSGSGNSSGSSSASSGGSSGGSFSWITIFGLAALAWLKSRYFFMRRRVSKALGV